MIFLADLPSPIHGMSVVNSKILDEFKDLQITHQVINTAPSYASHFYPSPFWSLIKALHQIFVTFVLAKSCLGRKNKNVYRSINGGKGQLYDALYIIIIRIFGKQLFVHHHSFNYLSKKSRLFDFLIMLMGKNATHFVLGEKMKSHLCDLYRVPMARVRVVSNLSFFDVDRDCIEGDELVHGGLSRSLSIGHLSNLTNKKGLDVFLKVCFLLEKSNIKYKAYLAGPCQDATTEDQVARASENLTNFQYEGPIYGEVEKRIFYERLNYFVFPSVYENEAEPLVLYEAARSGATLIGTDVGCMREVIESFQGKVLARDQDLAQQVFAYLNNQSKFQDLLNRKSLNRDLFGYV